MSIRGDLAIELNGDKQQNAGDEQWYGGRGEEKPHQSPPMVPTARQIPENWQRHPDEQDLLKSMMGKPPEPLGAAKSLHIQLTDEHRDCQHGERTGGCLLGLVTVPPAKPKQNERGEEGYELRELQGAVLFAQCYVMTRPRGCQQDSIDEQDYQQEQQTTLA